MAPLLTLFRRTKPFALAIVPIVAILFATPVLAASAPSLGSAGGFALLAGTAVTCTGPATIKGNVGVYPGTAISGFPTCTTTGTLHRGDATAHAASTAFLAAYAKLAATGCTQTVLGAAFTGVTLTYAPGVICFAAAATFTNVTLNLAGPANGVWIFKIGTAGTGALTGTGLTVAGTGKPCNANVYWWAAEAATLTGSTFQGTVLAGAGATITGGAFNGRLFAKAAVTVTGPATVTACGKSSRPGGSGEGNDNDNDNDSDKDNKDGHDGDDGHDGHDGNDHHGDGNRGSRGD